MINISINNKYTSIREAGYKLYKFNKNQIDDHISQLDLDRHIDFTPINIINGKNNTATINVKNLLQKEFTDNTYVNSNENTFDEDDDYTIHMLAVYAINNSGKMTVNTFYFKNISDGPKIKLKNADNSSVVEINDEEYLQEDLQLSSVDKNYDKFTYEIEVAGQKIPMEYYSIGDKNATFVQLLSKENSKINLQNGKFKGIMRVSDTAGNKTELPIDVNVNIYPLKVEIDDVVYFNGMASGKALKLKERKEQQLPFKVIVPAPL